MIQRLLERFWRRAFQAAPPLPDDDTRIQELERQDREQMARRRAEFWATHREVYERGLRDGEALARALDNLRARLLRDRESTTEQQLERCRELTLMALVAFVQRDYYAPDALPNMGICDGEIWLEWIRRDKRFHIYIRRENVEWLTSQFVRAKGHMDMSYVEPLVIGDAWDKAAIERRVAELCEWLVSEKVSQ